MLTLIYIMSYMTFNDNAHANQLGLKKLQLEPFERNTPEKGDSGEREMDGGHKENGRKLHVNYIIK